MIPACYPTPIPSNYCIVKDEDKWEKVIANRNDEWLDELAGWPSYIMEETTHENLQKRQI